MDTLTITITDTRVIDGYVQASNGAAMTPEDLVLEFINQQGERYANDFKIGIITSAAFIARFTPAEYGIILAATQVPEDATEEEVAVASEISGLITQLTSRPTIHLNDPSVVEGVNKLAAAGFIDESRVSTILSYNRPEPIVN